MLTKKRLETYLQGIGITLNGSQPFDIRINDPHLFRQMLFQPSLTAGEGYMEGKWDCDALDELFYRICRSGLDQKIYQPFFVNWQIFINHICNLQTPNRSLEVAENHYDLGNDFYRDMLGETMAYTCGYWKGVNTLDEAQYHKFDLICKKINLQPNERILDLGCGWGTLAKFMASKYGCRVVGVNISKEQVDYAVEICKGFPIEIYHCDYRDDWLYNREKKPFDKVVSIGLCEHVGFKNYKKWITTVRKNIDEDGLFLLHTIGRNDTSYFVDPWVRKYIFPNGMLPSIKLLAEAIENLFVIEDLHNFGADYDKTLLAWHKNFLQSWDKQKERGEKFYRMWNYYLLTNAGGFRARSMQLWQMVLSPNGVLRGYESVR